MGSGYRFPSGGPVPRFPPTPWKKDYLALPLHVARLLGRGICAQVAATRLQNKLSELGRPEAEINAAREIVRDAAHKVKNVHKRFGGHVITVRDGVFASPWAYGHLSLKALVVLADSVPAFVVHQFLNCAFT